MTEKCKISPAKYNDMWAENDSSIVAFCGFDCTGKTTQINLLKDYLQKKGIDFVQTRQPTDWYRKNEDVRRYLDFGCKMDQHYLSLLA